MSTTLDVATGTERTVPPAGVDPARRGGSTVGLSGRVGWALAALFVGFTGVQTWSGSLSVPGANLVALALIAVGLVCVWLALARPGGLSRPLQMLLLVALAVGIGYQAALTWLFDPAYGTDAAAFDQYAAWLTLHGQNPYVHSMAPAFARYQVPTIFHTFRLDGTTEHALSYPAGSFLLYVPLLAVGVKTQAANIVDLAFWLAGMFLLWWLLPRKAAWVAPLVSGGVLYVGFIIGGLTDALFVPFLLVAVYRWDRFSDRTLSRAARWVGPLALGAAASVKQTPWFFVPFLLVGVYAEAKADGVRPGRAVARYAALAATVFAAVNAPFVLAGPSAWMRGSLVPLLAPTIPDGQGLINLTIFERLGGGNLIWFTALGAVFILIVFLAFVLKYPALKRAWVPLVAMSFFFPTRSLSSYLFMLIPAALVAGLTVRPAAVSLAPRLARHGRLLLATGTLAFVGCATLAFTAPSPLSLQVTGTSSTGQLQTLDQLTVQVTNRTGRTVHPHFTVNATGHVTTFWYVLGPGGVNNVSLGPHQSATLVLHAPNTASMPSAQAPVVIEAFMAHPGSVSTSGRYDPSPLNTRIVPDAVNAPIAVGQPLGLTVQLENKYGATVHRAGVSVTLAQIVYGPAGYFPGEASINGRPEGASPVVAVTNAAGQATFTVRGAQPQNHPVTFQAWLTGSGNTPHSYSNQVSVQFVAPSR